MSSLSRRIWQACANGRAGEAADAMRPPALPCDAPAEDRARTSSIYNVNWKNDEWFGDTALHVSAISGNHECCELLLYAGADLDVKNDDGFTALDLSRNKDDAAVQNAGNVNRADALLRRRGLCSTCSGRPQQPGSGSEDTHRRRNADYVVTPLVEVVGEGALHWEARHETRNYGEDPASRV